MSEQSYPGSIFSLTDHEIFVVTAHHDGRDAGQIATWIMPATLVPDALRVVAVISPQNFTHTLIEADGRFALNMLAEDQYPLLPLFGLQSGRDVDKFAGIDVDRSPSGLPLLRDTCGWAECRILESIDAGDRRIYYAEVTAGHTGPANVPLRKQMAFAMQPVDIRLALEQKHRTDGLRDRELLRRYGEED
jgi:flavin reductase (DIM6/NTAB) family NADH-FMN oxidoreductase RutF